MLRDYKTGLSEDVGVFSGKEIEHTPAYGLQTLFLVRNDLTFDQIQSLCVHSNAEAIYYGANKSFMLNHGMQIGQIMQFLQRGYYVTVDYPYSQHDEIQKQFNLVWNHEKFIPFCSIIFPYVNKDEKLCIKVDDIDFNKTNPGVWTMSMDDFKKNAGYTKWEDYKKDEPIEEKHIWPAPPKLTQNN